MGRLHLLAHQPCLALIPGESLNDCFRMVLQQLREPRPRLVEPVQRLFRRDPAICQFPGPAFNVPQAFVAEGTKRRGGGRVPLPGALGQELLKAGQVLAERGKLPVQGGRPCVGTVQQGVAVGDDIIQGIQLGGAVRELAGKLEVFALLRDRLARACTWLESSVAAA